VLYQVLYVEEIEGFTKFPKYRSYLNSWRRFPTGATKYWAPSYEIAAQAIWRPQYALPSVIYMVFFRQAGYVERNTEARSYNPCCSGKARIVTYFECVFVVLDIQHAKRMRRIVSGLSGSTVFFHIIS
jgi:hypothetical protein